MKNNSGFSGSAADLAAQADLAGQEIEIAGILDRAAVNGEYVNRNAANGSWIYSVK